MLFYELRQQRKLYLIFLKANGRVRFNKIEVNLMAQKLSDITHSVPDK